MSLDSARVYLIIIVLLLPTFGGAGANNVTMSGFVTDSQSRLPLAGARVTVVGDKAKSDAVTDSEGSFIVTLGQGTLEGNSVRIRVQRSGYQVSDRWLAVSSTIPLHISLTPIAARKPSAPLLPIAKTDSFATLVPFHGDWKNSPIPMNENLTDSHEEFYEALMRLANRPDTPPEGWPQYKERKFESADEQFHFVGRLMQFYLLQSLIELERGISGGVKWTAGVGVTPINKNPITPPDSALVPTEELSAILSTNEFANPLVEFQLRNRPMPVPFGTHFMLLEHENPDKGEVFTCTLRFERPGYFRLDFDVQPGIATNNQLPAGFVFRPVQGTNTFSVNVAMHYEIQRSKNGFDSDQYARWADSLFEALQKQMGFDGATVGTQTQVSHLPDRKQDVGILSVECHDGLPPALMPAEGRLYLLDVWPVPVENGGGGLSEQSGNPGTELKWSTTAIAPMFRQCRITNYAESALFNISLSMNFRFRKTIKDEKSPGTIASGEVTLTRTWPINIQQIDTGPEHSFTFYIRNNSDQWVDVWFPETATARVVGSNDRRTFELISPERFFPPFGPVSQTPDLTTKPK